MGVTTLGMASEGLLLSTRNMLWINHLCVDQGSVDD